MSKECELKILAGVKGKFSKEQMQFITETVNEINNNPKLDPAQKLEKIAEFKKDIVTKNLEAKRRIAFQSKSNAINMRGFCCRCYSSKIVPPYWKHKDGW